MPPKGHKLVAEDLDRSVSIMRNRVDKLGVSEPEIRKQGSNQIVIELAGVHDPRQAAQIIGKTAQLELYDLETSVTGPTRGAAGAVIPKTKLYDLLAPVQEKAKQGDPVAYYLFDGKKLVAGPIASKDRIEEILAEQKAKAPAQAAAPKRRTRSRRSRPASRSSSSRRTRPSSPAARHRAGLPRVADGSGQGPDLLVPVRARPAGRASRCRR